METAGWGRDELAARLEAAGVPAGPINSVAEALHDVHVQSRGLRIERDGIPGIASPIVMDGVRMVSDGPSPHLDD